MRCVDSRTLFVRALLNAVGPKSDADHDLDRDVWGTKPSARQVRGAAVQNLSTAVARRRRVIDVSDSRRAEVLSVSGPLGDVEPCAGRESDQS